MLNALDVAWFFIDKGSDDPEMTQLKAQKLTYYAQGYALGIYGEPLFDEPIKAMKLGPVTPTLKVLQEYGKSPIKVEYPISHSIDDPKTLNLLQAVWWAYGGFEASMLVAMTHTDIPWLEAIAKGEYTEITKQSMKEYFGNRAEDLILDKHLPIPASCKPMPAKRRQMLSC